MKEESPLAVILIGAPESPFSVRFIPASCVSTSKRVEIDAVDHWSKTHCRFIHNAVPITELSITILPTQSCPIAKLEPVGVE